MFRSKSLKINFIMNSLLNMSSFLFPLITFPYVSRILLPEGIGRITFATSLIAYFTMLSQLGIPSYGIRECAKVRDKKEELTKLSHELLFINLIMCLFSYLIFIGVILFIPRLRTDRILYLILSISIFLSAIGMEWLYKALELYTYITIRSIIFKFIALIAMFLLVHEQSDYILYGAISILASSASNIFNFINVRKYIYLHPIYKYEIKKHLKPVFIFFAMSCAVTVYTNLDTIMLGFMASASDIGYYNAAVKIKTVLVSIVTSLGAVLLPRSSYYIEQGMRKQFWNISKRAINFVFIIAFPMMVYFFIFAKEGIYFIAGKDYQEAILPMQVIMPTVLFIGISNILGIQILVPLGKEKIVLYSEVAGAIIDLIINSLLIPLYTSVGAAIGTLIAEQVVVIIQYMSLRNEVGIIFKSVSYMKVIIAVLVASFAILWIKKVKIDNAGVLLISAFIFFIVYFIILILEREALTTEIYNQVVKNNKIKK